LTKQSLEELEQEIARLLPVLVAHCRSILKNYGGGYDEAEDVVQNALLRAHKSFGNFRQDCSLSSWLVTIVRNASFDWIRKYKKMGLLSDPLEWSERDAVKHKDLVDEHFGAHLNDHIDAKTALIKALPRLRPKERLVANMRANDMTIQEISDLLGRPLSTIKTWIYTGQQRLQRILTEKEKLHRPNTAFSKEERQMTANNQQDFPADGKILIIGLNLNEKARAKFGKWVVELNTWDITSPDKIPAKTQFVFLRDNVPANGRNKIMGVLKEAKIDQKRVVLVRNETMWRNLDDKLADLTTESKPTALPKPPPARTGVGVFGSDRPLPLERRGIAASPSSQPAATKPTAPPAPPKPVPQPPPVAAKPPAPVLEFPLTETSPSTVTDEEIEVSKTVPTKRIRANPEQPRTWFAPAELASLAESIKAVGQIMPVVVMEVKGDPNHDYELVEGERRWQCCAKHNIAKMRVVVRKIRDKEDQFVQSIIVNCNRAAHTPLEMARSIQKMMGFTMYAHLNDTDRMSEIGKAFGRSGNWAYVQLRMLKNLHPQILQMMEPSEQNPEPAINATVAQTIAKCPDQDLQLTMARTIIDRSLKTTAASVFVDRSMKTAGVEKDGRGRRPHDVWIHTLRFAEMAQDRATRLLENEEDLMRSFASQPLDKVQALAAQFDDIITGLSLMQGQFRAKIAEKEKEKEAATKKVQNA
jgi:ParB family chromosome partitioning protein